MRNTDPSALFLASEVDLLASSGGVVSPDSFFSALPADIERRWNEAEQRILGLSALQDDWDGAGAISLTPAAIASGVGFLKDSRNLSPLLPPSRIAPTPSGTIIVEWQTERMYFEAEVFDSVRIEFMSVAHDGTAEHWESPAIASDATRERESTEWSRDPIEPASGLVPVAAF